MALARALGIFVLVAGSGCGRLDFDILGDGGGSDATGPLGARYMIVLDGNGSFPLVAGDHGAVAVAEGFQGSTSIAGVAMTGHATFESWGLVWFDAVGTAASSSVLDSTSICHLRGLASANQAVVAVGHAFGTAVPAYGGCAIATSRQEGLGIHIDRTGAQQLGAHVTSSGFNTQAWYATSFADGTLGVSGIYGGTATLGPTPLPFTPIDENPFYARINPSTGTPRWSVAVVSNDSTGAGPMDADGDDACLLGGFSNTVTVLGTQVTATGAVDTWVARVDASGAPRWVRTFGLAPSAGAVPSIAATADGGCTVSVTADRDLSLDGLTLPLASGPAAILHFDATGTAVAGVRTPAVVQLAHVGNQVFAALGCAGPCTVAGATYTPTGNGIAIFSLSRLLVGSVVASLDGGAITLYRFVAVPPDALAITFSAQAQTTTFDTLTISPAELSSALAVMGVPP